MKYTLEMGSGVMMYAIFHNDWLRYSKVDWARNSQTQRKYGDNKATFIVSLPSSMLCVYL
jgi:hypothetical protein